MKEEGENKEEKGGRSRKGEEKEGTNRKGREREEKTLDLCLDLTLGSGIGSGPGSKEVLCTPLGYNARLAKILIDVLYGMHQRLILAAL